MKPPSSMIAGGRLFCFPIFLFDCTTLVWMAHTALSCLYQFIFTHCMLFCEVWCLILDAYGINSTSAGLCYSKKCKWNFSLHNALVRTTYKKLWKEMLGWTRKQQHSTCPAIVVVHHLECAPTATNNCHWHGTVIGEWQMVQFAISLGASHAEVLIGNHKIFSIRWISRLKRKASPFSACFFFSNIKTHLLWVANVHRPYPQQILYYWDKGYYLYLVQSPNAVLF